MVTDSLFSKVISIPEYFQRDSVHRSQCRHLSVASLPHWLCRHQPVYHGASTEHFDRLGHLYICHVSGAVSTTYVAFGSNISIMTDLSKASCF